MTTEKLLLSLPLPLAVVGNGPLDDWGTEIDNHASVIRLNNFRLNGHELQAGRKISAWCVNCWRDVPARHLSVPVFTVFHEDDDHARVYRWMGREGLVVRLPERRWSEEIRTLKPCKPSTGLLLLFALNELEVEASAFGFDGMTGGHYWNEHHEHDHPKEIDALSALSGISVRARGP